jgi:NitT/TauT family transport system permease protein
VAQGTAGPRRRLPLPIDVGLFAFAAFVVAALHLGSSLLRPFDAPEIDPRPALLPIYALRSLSRLAVAYSVAVLLALVLGNLAAVSRGARRVILPLLDVLQSVPILGFFPAAVTVFIGLFGGTAAGVEAAAVFLIFTSMFWNLAFGVYESLITLPEDIVLAGQHLGLRGPLRWSRLVLPAVVPSLVYNSILSWSNGWYFLMASEIIAAGHARYTLPGLGSYLAQAITAGRTDQLLVALLALLVITVLMHLLIWAPLEMWAERFHLEETGDRPRTPRIARELRRSRIVRSVARALSGPSGKRVVSLLARGLALPGRHGTVVALLAGVAALAVGVVVATKVAWIVVSHPLSEAARDIPMSLALSFLRVTLGVGIAVLLAVPLAYAVFRRRRLRLVVLSALQILGSIPATAFFPLIALVLVKVGLGMDVGAIVLVLTGTFFYAAFNVLSGAASIPKELNLAADALGLRRWLYVRKVFVPAVLPSLVTGAVTAWGGGWNAIIFSEYVVAGGRTYAVRGIGATLDHATWVTGDTQVVTLSLITMVLLVVVVNRVFWDPLYDHVAARYKMDA